MDKVGRLKLPPGFRFLPTDEELVLHFLLPNSTSSSSSSSQNEYDPSIIIPNLAADHDHQQLGLDPWDLTGKALLSSANRFLFFDDRMPRRIRTSRNGYWKDLHMEEPIFASGVQLATKKFLLFCRYAHSDEIEDDQETSWIMEEFHLCPSYLSSNKSGNQRLFEYDYSRILCRVHARKNCNTAPQAYHGGDDGSDISSLDEMFLSLDRDDYLDDIDFPN